MEAVKIAVLWDVRPSSVIGTDISEKCDASSLRLKWLKMEKSLL
jgi:hypothetical protein